jgi:hypothetical protein
MVGAEVSLASSVRSLRYCGSIEINESHQLFRLAGEQLEFSGVQRLAQQLQQEGSEAAAVAGAATDTVTPRLA